MTPCGGEAAGLRNVAHRYGNALALDGVTLSLPAGRLIGVIGPDGVGKSTLLGLIAGARQIVVRIAFNPNVATAWFTSVMAIINNITMLAIILAGAAVIREREHGTMDHLLVMPLTPFEIAMSKVWANALVIIVATGLSLYFVVRGLLHIPIAGSVPLFLGGVAIYLFFATAIGIFLATIARSMPQLGLLYLLVYMPMMMLSGSNTPLESMPPLLATIMQASPSTHFVSFAQAILYRGAGFSVVWPQFLVVALVGGLFFAVALMRFRSVSAVQS
jgi:ABC-2 type transport system permease protein